MAAAPYDPAVNEMRPPRGSGEVGVDLCPGIPRFARHTRITRYDSCGVGITVNHKYSCGKMWVMGEYPGFNGPSGQRLTRFDPEGSGGGV